MEENLVCPEAADVALQPSGDTFLLALPAASTLPANRLQTRRPLPFQRALNGVLDNSEEMEERRMTRTSTQEDCGSGKGIKEYEQGSVWRVCGTTNMDGTGKRWSKEDCDNPIVRGYGRSGEWMNNKIRRRGWV